MFSRFRVSRHVASSFLPSAPISFVGTPLTLSTSARFIGSDHNHNNNNKNNADHDDSANSNNKKHNFSSFTARYRYYNTETQYHRAYNNNNRRSRKNEVHRPVMNTNNNYYYNDDPRLSIPVLTLLENVSPRSEQLQTAIDELAKSTRNSSLDIETWLKWNQSCSLQQLAVKMCVDPSIVDIIISETVDIATKLRFPPNDHRHVGAQRLALREELRRSVTRNSTQRLLPGSSHRHATVFPFDMRARDDTMTTLKETLQMIGGPGGKEYKPVLLAIGMPRQGKTLLLDCIGNDRAVVDTFKAANGCAHCFIFNVTFNSMWSVEEKTSMTVENAKNHVITRLVAAAMGVYRRKVAKQLRFLSSDWIENFGIDDVSEILQDLEERLRVVYEIPNDEQIFNNDVNEIFTTAPTEKKQDPRKVCFILLFDEITKISSILKDDNDRRAFFSSITSAIDRTSAVVISGFHRSQTVLGFSDRKKVDLPLPPLTESSTYRPALAMSTCYFQQLRHPHDAANAVMYHELIKAAPGLMGAVIEGLIEDQPIEKAVNSIPMIATEIDEKSQSIEKILLWKSIQFVPFEPGSSMFARILEDCAAADLVMVAEVRSPTKKYFTTGSPRDSNDLSHVRMEPLVVHKLRGNFNPNHSLGKLAQLLEQFGAALTSSSSAEAASIVFNHFTPREGLDRTSATSNNNISYKAPPSFEERNYDVERKLAGDFFEDFSAWGVMLQKSLRHELAIKENIGLVKTNVSFLLPTFDESFSATKQADPDDNSSAISESLKKSFLIFENNSNSGVEVDWIYNNMPRPTHHFFKHSYPKPAFNSLNGVQYIPHEINKPNQSMNNFFTPGVVLSPRRPENNALADIIFHEKISGTDNRVVQFWIDVKHSHEQHNHIIYNLPQRFAEFTINALNNPLLQDNDCPVDHIVHIVISTSAAKETERMLLAQALREVRERMPSRPSYSFYVISPQSIAFENLVSQYVARTVPLLHHQQLNAWSQRIRPGKDWFKYRATTQNELDGFISSNEDLATWRKMRLDDESVSTCASGFDTTVLAKTWLMKIWWTKCRNSTQQTEAEKIAMEVVRTLPQGAIFEYLKIVSPHAVGTVSSDVSYLNGAKSLSKSSLVGLESHSVLISHGNFEFELDFLHHYEHWKWLRRRVRVGLLVDGDRKNKSDSNNDIWSFFFETTFLDCWRKAMGQHVENPKNRIYEESMAVSQWQKKKINETFHVLEQELRGMGPAMIAGSIWNANLMDWRYDPHHHRLDTHQPVFNVRRVCCRILRELSENPNIDKELRNKIRVFVKYVEKRNAECIPFFSTKKN